jgi:succinate dehydrogenase/fumarate reductase-like Fe-S protein
VSEARRRATIRVRRGAVGAAPRYDTWEVPYEEGMSVLDALLYVRHHEDPTLAVRFSCLNANACKECTALIDGKVGYLCTARLGERQPVTCEPLPKKRLIRDLVVDLTSGGEESLGD